MSLDPGTKLGPYEIQSLLGAGGMGEVYRARDTRLERSVAIKILNASVASSPDLKHASIAKPALSLSSTIRIFAHCTTLVAGTELTSPVMEFL